MPHLQYVFKKQRNVRHFGKYVTNTFKVLKCDMYINQQDAQNSCDQTLFSLYALHVSDCISPSSGAIATQQSDISAHTKHDIQLIKRLLVKKDWYSPKHVERTVKIKSNHKNFVHLVGLYTYCKMMHGSYNIILKCGSEEGWRSGGPIAEKLRNITHSQGRNIPHTI